MGWRQVARLLAALAFTTACGSATEPASHAISPGSYTLEFDRSLGFTTRIYTGPLVVTSASDAAMDATWDPGTGPADVLGFWNVDAYRLQVNVASGTAVGQFDGMAVFRIVRDGDRYICNGTFITFTATGIGSSTPSFCGLTRK